MITKILCPIDLTPASKGGVSYAFSLARRNTVQLTVFHAISFPAAWQFPGELDACYDWQQVISKFTTERLLADGERRVKRFICKHLSLESMNVPWRARVVLLGRLADEIIAAAFHEEADLIVMQRRQRRVLARILREGTLDRVSRAAPCPVLSIDANKSNIDRAEWPLLVLEQQPSY